MKEGYIYRMEHSISKEIALSLCVEDYNNGTYQLKDVEVIKINPDSPEECVVGFCWTYVKTIHDKWVHKEYGHIDNFPEYQI